MKANNIKCDKTRAYIECEDSTLIQIGEVKATKFERKVKDDSCENSNIIYSVPEITLECTFHWKDENKEKIKGMVKMLEDLLQRLKDNKKDV